MTGVAFLVAQLAAPLAAGTAPDIEFRARVRAERVEVEQQGKAQAELRVDPGTAEPVKVERSAPAGQRSYRNLTVDVRAAVHIADPNSATPGSTDEAQAGKPE